MRLGAYAAFSCGLCCTVLASAQAQELTQFVTGTIQSGADNLGIFGGGDLTGKTISIYYQYNSSLFPPAVNCGNIKNCKVSSLNSGNDLPGAVEIATTISPGTNEAHSVQTSSTGAASVSVINNPEYSHTLELSAALSVRDLDVPKYYSADISAVYNSEIKIGGKLSPTNNPNTSKLFQISYGNPDGQGFNIVFSVTSFSP